MYSVRRPFSLAFYEAAENMRATLDSGITTVREAGGSDLGIKTAQQRGMIAGPRMQISISMLSQTGGHGDRWQVCGAHLPLFVPHPGRPDTVVDGPAEMRRKVRELVRAGADVIKVATSGGVLSPRDDPRHGHFRDAELAVLVEEADAAGRFVMAHAQATDGIKAAIRNGVRSIEHGIYLDDEAIGQMLELGTYLVPTLMAPRGVLEAAEAGVPVPPDAVEKTKMVMEAHVASVSKAIGAGVKVAMGTDSGVTPHGRNLGELPLMVECGMSPAEALVATTRTAAELLGPHDPHVATSYHSGGIDVPGPCPQLLDLAGRVRDRRRHHVRRPVQPRRGRPARADVRHPILALDGRREDARRSIELIMDAARSILGKRPDASMEELAVAAGVTRQTVYAHFSSRDALIAAVFDAVWPKPSRPSRTPISTLSLHPWHSGASSPSAKNSYAAIPSCLSPP